MKLQCKCEHAYQDATYGPGMRVHNVGASAGKDTMVKYRCTVCGDQKSKYSGSGKK